MSMGRGKGTNIFFTISATPSPTSFLCENWGRRSNPQSYIQTYVYSLMQKQVLQNKSNSFLVYESKYLKIRFSPLAGEGHYSKINVITISLFLLSTLFFPSLSGFYAHTVCYSHCFTFTLGERDFCQFIPQWKLLILFVLTWHFFLNCCHFHIICLI